MVLRRVSLAAIVSFAFGLLSLFLFAITGVPAVAAGLVGLRQINASDGRLGGIGLAIAGMLLGTAGTLRSIVYFVGQWTDRAQARANQVECVEHLRQIGFGLKSYAALHKENYPQAALHNADLNPDRRLSWLTEIVPFLGRATPGEAFFQDLNKRIDRKEAWDAPGNEAALNTPVRLFLCPGHPHYNPRARPGMTHYVGLAGIDPEAANLPKDDPRAGVFGFSRKVGDRDMKAGMGYTMMVLETANENGPWLAGGFPSVRGLSPTCNDYIGPEKPFGGTHKGGLNVLWGDGSVRWVGDAVPPEDFRSQATLTGKAQFP
jgi:prepilin-type processing-associated H-X9-DG protein